MRFKPVLELYSMHAFRNSCPRRGTGGDGENMRTPGIEPGSHGCKPCMIPLHYMRLSLDGGRRAGSNYFEQCSRANDVVIYYSPGDLLHQGRKHAHAGSRTRVTSMGGLYDAATLRALTRD